MNRPPVAQLIYEHRLTMGISIREAARRAGISDGSWRRTEGPRDIVRTAETLARMAAVTGVTGDQLTGAGWPQAAEILVTIAPAGTPVVAPSYDELATMARGYQDDLRRSQDLMRKLERFIAGREQRDTEEDDQNEPDGSRRAG